jgi:hypothetical protein
VICFLALLVGRSVDPPCRQISQTRIASSRHTNEQHPLGRPVWCRVGNSVPMPWPSRRSRLKLRDTLGDQQDREPGKSNRRQNAAPVTSLSSRQRTVSIRRGPHRESNAETQATDPTIVAPVLLPTARVREMKPYRPVTHRYQVAQLSLQHSAAFWAVVGRCARPARYLENAAPEQNWFPGCARLLARARPAVGRIRASKWPPQAQPCTNCFKRWAARNPGRRRHHHQKSDSPSDAPSTDEPGHPPD